MRPELPHQAHLPYKLLLSTLLSIFWIRPFFGVNLARMAEKETPENSLTDSPLELEVEDIDNPIPLIPRPVINGELEKPCFCILHIYIYIYIYIYNNK